ncbi:hypothetical protein PMZ80_004378 [Knufia obscura]|uniref:Uncharacterized protein n=2 Tax=Knufia TaxID=430999 RepID=A0AAN8E7T4_9EURO|nr:hypothetical protein PMZ80_004378 [Knufia obscura]KAK5948174.1 hypothetical protein OHC33_010827 [Knufia fluminis]
MNGRLNARQDFGSRRPGQDDATDDGGGGDSTVMIVALVAVAVFVTAVIAFYIVLRRLRAQGRSPKYLPSKFLKRKWEQWQPKGKYRSVSSTERGENGTNPRAREETAAVNAAAAGVDRNTSVRSVMTLPPYSQAPKETEQVIGREGERGGMDTVVEFPETAEEEEQVRDAEMEALYQIRQARRREIEEREQRRRERREARERGDWQRLEELRRESRQRNQPAQNASSTNLTAETLIAEHASRPKDRRVSSVAYAEVGQVRHDGTRLRANSTESERGGLLSGAAPFGEGAHGRNNSDATSLMTLDNLSRPTLPWTGGRQRSDSGALSISTTASSFELPQATPTTTDEAAHRTSDSSEQQNSASTSDSPTNARFTPPESEGNETIDPRIVSMIQDSDNDIARPPEYDHHDWGDAPTYEEALRRAESMRSARLAVPTINVQMASEPNSPAVGRISEEGA